MKCPRCQALLNASADAQGFIVCSGCGARLRTRPAPAPEPPAALDRVLSELEALRKGQEEILSLLRGSGGAPAPASAYSTTRADADADDDVFRAVARPAIRSGRRKSVLVIDDDQAARSAVVAALEKAQVPVAAVSDGNAALAHIAEDKPDVIVLELEIGGSMGGRDVVNMIKATMEWVDIPIVLHTRAPIESQKEARQVHGADDFVAKSPGSAPALVSRVIALFRKG